MFRQATAAFELAKNKDARRLAPDTYARAMRSSVATRPVTPGNRKTTWVAKRRGALLALPHQ